jgi:hypothetical protein
MSLLRLEYIEYAQIICGKVRIHNELLTHYCKTMQDINTRQIQLIHHPLQQKKYKCGFYTQLGTSEEQGIRVCPRTDVVRAN